MSAFLDAMRAKWAEYGNVYSPKLQIVWLQIEATLDYQSSSEALCVWPVIPAELGVGKTTVAKLWCSITSRSALVVVRTREQAKEFATDVNAWAGDRRAVALFSPEDDLPNELWYSPEETRPYQIVVVCHKSYELGLDEFSLQAAHARFETVHKYGDEPRDVVIIDEALDQVAEARIERGAVTTLVHLLSRAPDVEHKHKDAMRVLDSVARALREAPLDQHRALSTKELLALAPYTPDEATAYVDSLWQDIRIAKRIKPEPRAIISEILSVLRRHLNTAPWTNKKAVSSARLLRTPKGVHGVILDATAALHSVYATRKREFDLRHVSPVRDYSAVTIYEALTNDTGKTRVRAKASTLVAKAIADLKDFYGEQAAERRVLVVTSADPSTQEAVRTAMAAGVFAEWDLTNWRRVDGRNEWAKFDTLLVLSLHYGSSTQDINTWLAVRGLQPDDATLNATDEIRAIKERRIAADLAQAIGRLRLRTMTNPNGTCEPCDVFVRLPNFKGVVDSEKVMAAVASTLPGIVRAKWDRQSRKLRRDGRAPRERGAVVGRLVALADQVAADGVTRELTQETLKTSNGTLHRVFDQVKAGRVELPAGVRLVPGGYAAGVRGQSPATLVRA